MVQFGVRTKDVEQEDGSIETKEYQTISTKAFASSKYMKFFFRNYASKNFDGLLKDGDNKTFYLLILKQKLGMIPCINLANFLNNIFGEYGISEFSVMEEIREYNSEENP